MAGKAEKELEGVSDEGERARAKTLPPRVPMVTTVPALVPARMINEVIYCERLLYLEWAQGEFADNAFTVEGCAVHKRADQPRGELPPAPAADEGGADGSRARAKTSATTDEPDIEELIAERPYEARSLWLSSERLGITAKIDVVEGSESGVVLPIEYKRGAAPDLEEGAYLPERAQVAAQALLLREHGYRCDEGAIYFAKSKRRVPIPITEHLKQTVEVAVARAREVVGRGAPPPPLDDSPKCHGCSLSGICLPDETNLLRGLAGEPLYDGPEEVRAPIEDDLSGP